MRHSRAIRPIQGNGMEVQTSAVLALPKSTSLMAAAILQKFQTQTDRKANGRVHAFQTAVRRIIEHHERVYKDYLYLVQRETTVVLKSLAKPKCTQDVRIRRPYEAHVLVLSSE